MTPILTPQNRIVKLAWRLNDGINMQCEVGLPLPLYFETGSEPVLEIIDCWDHYEIRTESRGGSYGAPVRAGKDGWSTESTQIDPAVSEVVFLRAVAVLGSPENAIIWLKTANPTLGDIRPVDRLRTGAGVEAVLDSLGRIEQETHCSANRSSGGIDEVQSERIEDEDARVLRFALQQARQLQSGESGERLKQKEISNLMKAYEHFKEAEAAGTLIKVRLTQK